MINFGHWGSVTEIELVPIRETRFNILQELQFFWSVSIRNKSQRAYSMIQECRVIWESRFPNCTIPPTLFLILFILQATNWPLPHPTKELLLIDYLKWNWPTKGYDPLQLFVLSHTDPPNRSSIRIIVPRRQVGTQTEHNFFFFLTQKACKSITKETGIPTCLAPLLLPIICSRQNNI